MQNVKKIIPRSMSGLRDALFDALERVRDGDMPPEEAREIVGIARVIIESVDVQMDFEVRKGRDELPQHLPDMHMVPPLTGLKESVDSGGMQVAIRPSDA